MPDDQQSYQDLQQQQAPDPSQFNTPYWTGGSQIVPAPTPPQPVNPGRVNSILTINRGSLEDVAKQAAYTQQNQPKSFFDRMADTYQNKGAFRNQTDFFIAANQHLEQMGIENGIDLSSPKGQEWIHNNMQRVQAEMAPLFLQPRDPKNVKTMDDGKLVDATSGEVIYDPMAKQQQPQMPAPYGGQQMPPQAMGPSGQPSAPPTQASILDQTQQQLATLKNQLSQVSPSSKAGKAIQSEIDKSTDRMIKLLPGQGGLAPETVNALATSFAKTGEIPSLGMGKASTEARTQILNKYAEDMKNQGGSVDDRLRAQTAYKASAGELKKLQAQRGVVMAFADTADKNLDLVSSLSDKVSRTGIPVLNKWLNSGKRSVAGDPELSQFDAALRTAVNEYAKVTSSASGGGVTSDSARKEVDALLNAAQTPEQVKSVIGTLKKEMGNRRSGYDNQISSIMGNLSGTPHDASEPPPVPDGMRLQKNAKTGQYRLVPQ